MRRLVDLVKDKAELTSALRGLAKTPGLRRIVICHGHNIEDDPGVVLGRIADKLEGKR